MSRRSRIASACLLGFAGLAFVGCKKRTFNTSGAASAGAFGKPSQVVVQCLAPQGNGGNWASSLGWVAEQWLLRAETVAEAEARSGAPKDSSWISLSCASGGSSGSGVTTVVMSVLQNEALFEDSGDTARRRRRAGFYTPSEVERLGRAVRYVAIGADLKFLETVEFMGLLAGQWLLAGNTGARELLGKFKRRLDEVAKLDVSMCSNKYRTPGNEKGVEWWDGQAAEPCDAVVNFGKYAWLAKNVTYQMITESIQSPANPLGSSTALATASGMKVLSDLPLLPNMGPGRVSGVEAFGAKSKAYADLRELGHKQSLAINARLDALLANTKLMPSRFAKYDFKEAPIRIVESIGDVTPGSAHPIALNVLGRAPDKGFFTITTSVVDSPARFTGANATKVPTYPEIRYVVFGSEDTMRLIGGSPLLKSHLDTCAKEGPSHPTCFAKRFVLGVVKQTHYMIQPSVREPDLMEELTAPAWGANLKGAQHMGLVKMRDLASDSPDFVDLTQGDAGSKTVFGVTGGWPDRRITAWLQAYLVDALIHGDAPGSKSGDVGVAAAGAPITLFNSMFGKPDTEPGASSLSVSALQSSIVLPTTRSKAASEDKFDTKAVRSFFSKSDSGQEQPDKGAEHVSDYIDFQTAYYTLVGPQPLASMLGVGVVHDEVSVNWDLFKLPAFLNLNVLSDPQRSRHLVHLSTNAVREGAPGKEHVDKPGGQICQVVSAGKLGRTSCSRTILSSQGLLLGGIPYMDAVAAVRARSGLVFNAGDPRLADKLPPEEFEAKQVGQQQQ